MKKCWNYTWQFLKTHDLFPIFMGAIVGLIILIGITN